MGVSRMGTPSRTPQASWRRRATGLLIAGVLLASASCTGSPADVGKAENSTVISYSGAVSRLRGLDPTEVDEQLRDWARIGLASHLELNTAQLRNAAYDTVPVRDAAFADLARQPTGPGRALFDGHGVLHVLVPRGDPHEARTIGLLIDQYRADAGADPQQVQLHHYQLHPGAQTIELTPDKPAPTADVRSAHGFVTMRVDETKRLTDFLARTQYLSWLELRGSEVWAGGWNWPDVPAAPLDAEDVSVIQRGYLQPPSRRRPAFSLDPGPKMTKDDILAVIPGLRADLADLLANRLAERLADRLDRLIPHDLHDLAGSRFPVADPLGELGKAVDDALFRDSALPAELGLPADRTQLWALNLLLKGRSGYSQARNDGKLEGTKVGMTLFYTDKVAKDWVSGVGSGVPAKAVGGFIPDSEAPISWSHCDGADAPTFEHGRLWFGQNDASFTFDGDRVNIGALATRLFSRSEQNGGTEVEPSFSFGRGLRWWDQHFQAVADYEPQYQRLEQIMRWSGALDWLASRARTNLPQLDDGAIQSGLYFKDWYAQHNELRERSPIRFVTPPSATHEAVMAEPSKTFPHCGLVEITGGVSLGDSIERQGGRNLHPNLPGPIRRGGLFDATSHFDENTGSGQIKQEAIDSGGHVGEHVQRTLSTAADGHAVIDVRADGRRVNSLGNVKVPLAETATRQLGLDLAADRGRISERVQVQSQELGRLTAVNNVVVDRTGVDTVTVQWKPGPLDRLRRVAESVQDRLAAGFGAGLPPASDGMLYTYSDIEGRVLGKIGGPGAPWSSITSDLTPPGSELTLRLGAPDPGAGGARFLEARMSPGPELPPGGGGGPPWMEVTQPAGDRPPQVLLVEPPREDAIKVQVTTIDDGRSFTVYQTGDRWAVPGNDPVFGRDGTVEGAALLSNHRAVIEAMRSAAQAKDGLWRGVLLGEDGVALAGPDKVILSSADHQIADRVRRAVGYDPSVLIPLIHLEGIRALHVDQSPLTTGSRRKATVGELLDTSIDNTYWHRSMLGNDNGVTISAQFPRSDTVIVLDAVVADRPNAESTATQPDIRMSGGGEWWRVPSTGAGPGSTVTSTPPLAGPGGGVGPAPSGPILLVCPDTSEKLPGCEQ